MPSARPIRRRGADEIVFAAGTNGTAFDVSGATFTITESLTITGNGANDTVIDAHMFARIFDITNAAVNVTISGVTLKNGRVSGAGVQTGGAIRSAATGILSISSSLLSVNSVNDTTGSDAYGGAVFVSGGSLTVFGSTITGNTANWGGAIYAAGDSDVSITVSNVDGNFASNDGGAIYAGFGGQGDVTITGSTLENNISQVRGGAIRADNVTISGSTVRLNNSTTEGGAIAADGNVSVTSSTVSENTSSTQGGAIHAGGNVTVTSGSTINDNTAIGKGGAILSVGSTEVTNSTISGNSTTGGNANGGAIYTNSGTVTISQSTLSGNSTTGSYAAGGAIFARNGAVTVSQSTLSGNSTTGSSAHGGAIITYSGAVTVSQSTLSGNSAVGLGGAIGTSGAMTVSQSTLTLNVSQLAGGAISTDSFLTITNSIVAGNTDGGAAPDVRKSVFGQAFTVTNSLIGRNNGTGLTATSGTTPGANGNLVGGDRDALKIIPQLGPLANNGGPTQTHALLATSPAINRGSNALAVDVTQAGNPALTTDQRGNPFPRIFDTTVDMGAYERFTGPLVVSTNVDESDGNFSSGDLSLREAIELANSRPEINSITFATSTNGTEFDLSLFEMFVAETLTITGNGAANTVIDAQQASRIFNFQAGDFTLNGVTLKNGKTTADGNGGGAIASSSSGLLTIQNSTLSGNSTDGNNGPGGAIYSNTGAVAISHSTLSGNSTAGTSASGGAIFARSGAVTINQSTLSGNFTTGNIALGGAISTSSGAVTTSQSTLTLNNAAQGAGGAIFSLSSPVTILNSIVAGNTDNGTAPDVQRSVVGDDPFFVTNSLIGRNNGTGLTATGSTPGLNGNLIGGDNAGATIAPLLSPLANNGGPTQTHALQLNSPAFNRGSNALAVDVTRPGNPPLTLDQRGSGFARNRFGIVDMGALESAVLDSPEGTTGADAFVLTYSSTTTAGTVTVTVSTGAGPVFNLGTFPMNSPLTIDGLGGTDSVRAVGTSSADTFTVTSSSLTINGASLILTSIENRSLAGAAGGDMYKFDADAALGTWTLDEAVSGTDAIDLALTTTQAVNLNLGLATTTQVVNANLSLILGSATTFENAIGGSGADTIIGNSLANTLTGGPGNDTLRGSDGSDNLFGGLNDDTYIFDVPTAAEADIVNEFSNQGTDTVSFAALTTSVTFSLNSIAVQPIHTNRTLKLNSAGTFENAIGGSAADTLTGNALSNVLTGGNGGDNLNGGAGNDELLGGLGDDKYKFSAPSGSEVDLIREFAGQGTDTVDFSALTVGVTFSLTTNSVQLVHVGRTLQLNATSTFENLIGGSAADTLTGNSLTNALTGGPGNDILNGLAGNDNLFGGLNDDTYIFGVAAAAEADIVNEYANQGTDRLSFASLTTSVTLSLSSIAVQPVHTNRTLKLNSAITFENIVGGSANDTLLGNALNNQLTGGNGNNILVGNAGMDTLVSGIGRDILIGGLGLDTLSGGSNEDILIAGRTTSDVNVPNLLALQSEWISANSYTTRITNLRAGVGAPVVSLKATINVLNDAGEDDILTGGIGTDWYFRALDDVITDLFAGETIDLL